MLKCPRCGVEGKHLVMESRPHEGSVYRRRACGPCGRTYVTVEATSPGLKFPSSLNKKIAEKKPSKTRVAHLNRPAADALHLQSIWK